MSDPDSSAAIAFWELIAECGFILVIFGVVIEGSELLVKWGKKKRFRKRFNEAIRRRLVFTVKFLRPRILPFETIGFLVLVIGLSVEFIGSSFATRLQGKENATLKKRASQLEKDAAIANERTL